MWRKHLLGISFAFLIILVFSIVYLFNNPLTSDKKLTENFYNHQANFERLVKMADEDKNVMSVYKDSVALNGYYYWRDDSQEGFSSNRWNEYKKLFKELGVPFIHRVSKSDGIIQISSASIAVSDIDDYERIVISKGYAYSLKEPSPLVDSLDGMGFKTQGTFYKRIDKNWYLFFDGGISKPE